MASTAEPTVPWAVINTTSTSSLIFINSSSNDMPSRSGMERSVNTTSAGWFRYSEMACGTLEAVSTR